MFHTKFIQTIKTNFVFSNIFFFQNHVVYEIMWKGTVKQSKPLMTIWRMRIECWITATHTHTHNILIAFPLLH
jgi:hypothetical protein